MDEQAKAISEIAKTTGKAIDSIREAGGFISRYISIPLEQGVGIFGDKLRYMRWERQGRLIIRANEFLKASGLDSPTRAVPLKLAVPLFEGAMLEEDDELQDRWAALLVNAANADFGFDINRSYVAILEQITALEAKIMDVMYSKPLKDISVNGVLTRFLPEEAIEPLQRIGQPESDPSTEIILALSNLNRLGCVSIHKRDGGRETFGRVYPTELGKAFVTVCQIPKP